MYAGIGDVIRLFGETEYYRIMDVSRYPNGYRSTEVLLSDGRWVPIMKIEAQKLSDFVPEPTINLSDPNWVGRYTDLLTEV